MTRMLLFLLQEKRKNREETRLQKTLDNNKNMAEKLIPASIESMDQNLSSLLDKCKACRYPFPMHISLSRGSQFGGGGQGGGRGGV